jgi:hypothetical protein
MEQKVAKIFFWIILIMSGAFLVAFTVALIVEPYYRTWDRAFTYITFALLFTYLLAQYIAARKR